MTTTAEAPDSPARNRGGDPFGLVHENVIDDDQPGQVQIPPVRCQLHGIGVAADVRAPAGSDSAYGRTSNGGLHQIVTPTDQVEDIHGMADQDALTRPTAFFARTRTADEEITDA